MAASLRASAALVAAALVLPSLAGAVPVAVKLRGVGISSTGLTRFFKLTYDPINDHCSITDEGCGPLIRHFRCVAHRNEPVCPWARGAYEVPAEELFAATPLAPDGRLLAFWVPFEDGSLCYFTGLVPFKRIPGQLWFFPYTNKDRWLHGGPVVMMYTGTYECMDSTETVLESGSFAFDSHLMFGRP